MSPFRSRTSRPFAIVSALILCSAGYIAPAWADISITSLSGDVHVTGAAGLTFDPDYDEYTFNDFTSSLGSTVSVSGSALSGPTTASSLASLSTTARADGFAAHLESTASVRGPNGSAIGVPTLWINFTLTDTGPLWVQGLSTATGGDVELILEGPLSRLYYYLEFSAGTIDFYAPSLEAGDYGLICRAPSSTQSGDSVVSTDFIVSTVPAPSGALLVLAGFCVPRRPR